MFYVATALERGEEAKTFAAALANLGHELSYAWWDHGSVQSEGPDRIAEVARAESGAILRSSLFVALLPGGRGTHIEIGLAIAAHEKRATAARNGTSRIVLVGPLVDSSGRECSFYRHERIDARLATVEEALAFFRGIWAAGGLW